ncbi:MAG: hypothetical protein K8F91_12960, partial [Candidatus Obscuribacterales bacterium]|nr:hypothetical protein [Candidatus Obscuribacterales bacterium]
FKERIFFELYHYSLRNSLTAKNQNLLKHASKTGWRRVTRGNDGKVVWLLRHKNEFYKTIDAPSCDPVCWKKVDRNGNSAGESRIYSSGELAGLLQLGLPGSKLQGSQWHAPLKSYAAKLLASKSLSATADKIAGRSNRREIGDKFEQELNPSLRLLPKSGLTAVHSAALLSTKNPLSP